MELFSSLNLEIFGPLALLLQTFHVSTDFIHHKFIDLVVVVVIVLVARVVSHNSISSCSFRPKIINLEKNKKK